MYIPKWGSNFCFTFPTSEGSDLLSSHVMQTPTFISKLSDGNVIFRLDVGKRFVINMDLLVLDTAIPYKRMSTLKNISQTSVPSPISF
jgi:hypothetical protein